jgi:hypothetical protein
MSLLEADDVASSIVLHIIVPQCCVTPVLVSGQALIGSIDSQFPGRSFLYNGELLQHHRTFASYGIHSSDSIVAVASDGTKAVYDRWVMITRESDTFDEMVRAVVNQESRNENLRLHDIRALRLESRPRTYARFLKTFEPPAAAKSPQGRIPTVIPCPASGLCEERLPAPW